MHAIAVMAHMPVQHLRQCGGIGRRRLDRGLGGHAEAGGFRRRRGRHARQRREHILQRFRLLQQVRRQVDGEGALDPQEKLGAREAVEPPVALERHAQGPAPSRARVQAQFPGQFFGNADQCGLALLRYIGGRAFAHQRKLPCSARCPAFPITAPYRTGPENAANRSPLSMAVLLVFPKPVFSTANPRPIASWIG